MYIAISIAFLVLLGFSILKGRYARAGIGETSLMYRNQFVQFILSILFLIFLGLLVFLIFYNWKLLLILLLVGFVMGNFVFVPIAERIMYLILRSLVKRLEKDDSKLT